jgi:hypothetical protein
VAARAVEQLDQPVVGRYLGHRVADGQGARRQGRAVTGADCLVGGRLEMRPGRVDLPGEQEAAAEPHFQAGIQGVPPPRQRDSRLPPCRRVLPGQEPVGGLGGRPCGAGRGLVADAGPALHGVVGQVAGLPPPGVPEGSEDPRVQLGTPGRGELFLYRVPDQRVDEAVSTGAGPIGTHEPGAHRRVERRDRAGRAGAQGRGQRRVLEITAQDRRHLQRVPAGGRERREPLLDHLPDAPQRRAGPRPVVEQLDALRDEQRVPAGARVQVARVDAADARGVQPLRHAVVAQPGQLASAATGLAGQAGDHVSGQRRGRHLGVAVGQDHPYRGRPERLAEIGQEPQRSLIRAVQVIDHYEVRDVSGRIPQRVPDPLVEAEPRRRAFRRVHGDRRLSQPAQHLQPGPQRGRAFALPAAAPRHRRAGGTLRGFPGQAGLAHARIPGEQDETARSGGRLRGQRIENGKLGVPAYEHARRTWPPTATL